MTRISDRQLLNLALREDLLAFTIRAFATVSPGAAYRHNWHIEAITHALRNAGAGTGGRLIITQPPRSLKSICTSVAYVAWALGRDPSLEFICVSYSNELAAEFSRQFRLVVNAAWYRKVFPGMRAAKETATEFVTSKGGGRYATSIDGSLTGFGADIIIIDDPHKAEEASSVRARQKVIYWYGGTLVSRLNDKEKGAIILVMQRLHEEDLAGHLLSGPSWEHLDLPAIAIEDQEIRIGEHAAEVHHRKAGDILHPERESKETLEKIKADIGSLAYSAQYQQRPVPLEGNLVKIEWFRHYDSLPEGAGQRRIVQSWDVASTTSARSNYSVCTTWAICGKDYYLIDLWRGRLEFPKLKRQVIRLQKLHGAGTVIIEKAGLGLQLIQDLIEDSPASFPRPIGIMPDGNKVTRMEAQTAKMESGQVVLPKDAPWLGEFLHEIMAFPNSRFDDQVDSLSQFLAWVGKEIRHRPQIAIVGPEIFYFDDD